MSTALLSPARDQAEAWRRHVLGYRREDGSIQTGRGLIGVPREAITAELLAMADGMNCTVLHWEALLGDIRFIPVELLTAESVSRMDDEGDSVLHCAAHGLCFDLLPESCFTAVNLRAKNAHGLTPLDIVATTDTYLANRLAEKFQAGT